MSLDYVFYHNSLRSWLIALAFGAGAYALIALLKQIGVARLGAVASRTANDIDDALVDLVARTRWFSIAAFAAWIAAPHLWFPDADYARAKGLLAVILLFQVGLWLVGLIGFLTGRALKRRHDADDRVGVAAIRALGVATKVIACTLLVVIALRWAFGLDVTLLVTSLGVGGIAIALAVQTILGDLLAAVSIVFDQPFDVGDEIAVENVSGIVEKIGLKTTRLRSATGEQIIFSNANLLKSRIHNLSRMAERRASFVVDVGPNTVPEVAARVPALIEGIVVGQPLARFVRCHLTHLTETAFRYECVYHVQDRDLVVAMNVQQAINLEMLRRFAAEQIQFARPTVAAIVKQ